MSNIKRFITMAIAFVMVLATMVPAFALSDDVAGTEFENSAALLGALEIMVGDAETGNFRPNDPIRRSEAAKVAVHTLGLEDIAEISNSPTRFPDVVSNHWANGYIKIAEQQGLVIGDDVGTFRPDDSITYAEIITMLVRALGYEPAANAMGGYPTGFMIVASQNGITKNTTGVANQAVNRGTVAQLVYNALTVDIMEQVGFGNNISYEVQEGKTILNSKLEVEELKGQVTANEYTRLSGTSGLKENEVIIDGEKYNGGYTNAKDLLGYNVEFYVKEIDNENVIIAIMPDEKANEVLTVQADDIDERTTTSELVYWIDKENDSTPEEVEITEDAYVIYNGKALSNVTANDLRPASGKVVLLDTDRDDVFDVVFVTSYDNFVVDYTNAKLEKIYFKDGTPASITLDSEDKNLQFRITKDGQEIAIEDLEEWDILSIARSKDNKLINILVSSTSIEGIVTEVDDDKRVINGVEYEIAKNLIDKGADIALETEGTFYLDIDGKIAAHDTTSLINDNYAYLIDAAEAGGFGGVYEFKLLTTDGEIVILESANKIRFNGTRGDAEDAYAGLLNNGEIVPQLITYEVNSNGNIDRIDTAIEGENKYEFSRDIAKTQLTYNANTGKLGNAQYVGENTVIFDINGNDPDDYTVRKTNVFKDKATYTVEVFDIQDDRTIGAVVLYDSGSGNILDDANITVVDRITITKNSDGVNVQKLYGINNGEDITVLAEDDSILDGLAQGDVIQFETNANGEINEVRVLFDASEKALVEQPGENSDMETMFVKVVDRIGNRIIVDAEGQEIPFTVNDENVTVYKYEADKKKVYVTDAGDIEKSDDEIEKFVFIRLYEDVVEEIVILD